MARITQKTLVASVRRVAAMDIPTKLKLVDEMFREQPNMLASVLVQKQLGVSEQKMDFLVQLVLVLFVAMRESGIDWPCISVDEQDRQMNKTAGMASFNQGLAPELLSVAADFHLKDHPEKVLLAHVVGNISEWMQKIEVEESDKYIMLVAINTVNCLAYCALPQGGSKRSNSKARPLN